MEDRYITNINSASELKDFWKIEYMLKGGKAP